MAELQLAERVDTLEHYMKELSYQALKTEMELAQLSREMKTFKEEMKAFREESESERREMNRRWEELAFDAKSYREEAERERREMNRKWEELAFDAKGYREESDRERREMNRKWGELAFDAKGYREESERERREMNRKWEELAFDAKGYREESDRERREMNRKWGELANKMGTLAEDLVAPNLSRIARELMGCEKVELFTVRMRKEIQGRKAEYDVLVVCPDVVWINETKSSLRARDVDELVDKLREFRDFFPEYKDRKLVGVLASLSADESLIRNASASGILVMAMGPDTMDVLNPESLKVF